MAKTQYFLVAGPFAFLDKTLSDPMHQRIKAEQCFRYHVDGSSEIVAAPDVTEFVDQDALQLFRSHPFHDSVRQQKDGLKDADDGGFEEDW
jgi:hypothetical protein